MLIGHGAVLALAVLLHAGAALCFYLAAPRQQWLSQPWPARPARRVGAALLLAALVSWGSWLQPAATLFAWLTFSMLLFAVLPYLAALRTLLKGPA